MAVLPWRRKKRADVSRETSHRGGEGVSRETDPQGVIPVSSRGPRRASFETPEDGGAEVLTPDEELDANR